jgi:hypothetical protein
MLPAKQATRVQMTANLCSDFGCELPALAGLATFTLS